MVPVLPQSASRQSPSGLSGAAFAGLVPARGETADTRAAAGGSEDTPSSDFVAALDASHCEFAPAVGAGASTSPLDASSNPRLEGGALPGGGTILPEPTGQLESGDRGASPVAGAASALLASAPALAPAESSTVGAGQRTGKGIAPVDVGAGSGAAISAHAHEAIMDSAALVTRSPKAPAEPIASGAVEDAAMARPGMTGASGETELARLPRTASQGKVAGAAPASLAATSPVTGSAAREAQVNPTDSIDAKIQAKTLMLPPRNGGGGAASGTGERSPLAAPSPGEPSAPATDASAPATAMSKPSAPAESAGHGAPAAPAPGPPATSGASSADARGDARMTGQVEAALDQLAGSREGQRNLRPEVNLRHGEFGQVNLRLDASGEGLRATLTAHDPGFVPAVRQALTERVGFERLLAPEQVVQSGIPIAQRVVETAGGSGAGLAGGGSQGGAGGGPNQNAGQNAGQNHSGHHSGQASGQSGPHSDPRYGSSPGSDQGTPQPYSASSLDEGREGAFESDPAETGDAPGSRRVGRERGLYA